MRALTDFMIAGSGLITLEVAYILYRLRQVSK